MRLTSGATSSVVMIWLVGTDVPKMLIWNNLRNSRASLTLIISNIRHAQNINAKYKQNT